MLRHAEVWHEVLAWHCGRPGDRGRVPDGRRPADVAADHVDLVWTDNSLFESGFRIERATVHGKSGKLKFAAVGSVGRDATAFRDSDSDLKPHKRYAYRVVAFNRAGDSPPSGVLVVTTDSRHGK